MQKGAACQGHGRGSSGQGGRQGSRAEWAALGEEGPGEEKEDDAHRSPEGQRRRRGVTFKSEAGSSSQGDPKVSRLGGSSREET